MTILYGGPLQKARLKLIVMQLSSGCLLGQHHDP